MIKSDGFVAKRCALTGEDLVTATEVESGIKDHVRKSTRYDEPEAKSDGKAAKQILSVTSMPNLFEPKNGKKPTTKAIKNSLVYMIASIGPGGAFRERYVAALGLLGYHTLAKRLALAENLNYKTRAVRVVQDGDKLIVDTPFSYAFNNEVRGKKWEFFGSSESTKRAFQQPYVSKSTGQVFENVRVLDAQRLPEVQTVLQKCFAGQALIVERDDGVDFNVL